MSEDEGEELERIGEIFPVLTDEQKIKFCRKYLKHHGNWPSVTSVSPSPPIQSVHVKSAPSKIIGAKCTYDIGLNMEYNNVDSITHMMDLVRRRLAEGIPFEMIQASSVANMYENSVSVHAQIELLEPIKGKGTLQDVVSNLQGKAHRDPYKPSFRSLEYATLGDPLYSKIQT